MEQANYMYVFIVYKYTRVVLSLPNIVDTTVVSCNCNYSGLKLFL